METFVQLLDPPAGVVQVGEGSRGIALAVQQRGGARVVGAADGVLDEADAAGPEDGLGLLAAGLGAGLDGDEGVAAVAAEEVTEDGVGVGLEAEDGVGGALGVQQAEGIVAAVVDDDIAALERGQVGEGGAALVGVAEEVEVERQAGAQLEEAAEQALGVVRRVGGGAVAVVP